MSAPALSDYSEFFRAPRPRALARELMAQGSNAKNIEVGKLMLKAAEKIGELGYAYRKLAKVLSAVVVANGGQVVIPYSLIKSIRDFEELDITDADEQGNVYVTIRGAALASTPIVNGIQISRT